MIYTVKQKGKVVHRGDINTTAEFINMTNREVYTVVKASDMNITISSEKDPPKIRPVGVKKTVTLKDKIKAMLMIYDNTVLGDEPKDKVDKALVELAKEGFVLQAKYNKEAKGWLIERKH